MVPGFGASTLGALSRRTIVIPVLVGVVLLAMVIAGWQAVQHEREHRVFADTERVAELVAARLESHIQARLAIGRNLRLNWAHGNIVGFDAFQSHARSAHQLFGDFQAINWVDPEGIIRWVTPTEGNEAAQDLNIRKLAMPAKAIAAAVRTGTVQVTPPIKLAQGGEGFVAYIPLTRDGVPDGFLNIVFRTGSIIAAALRGEPRDRYRIDITDEGEQVYRSGGPTAATRDEHTQPAVRHIQIGNRTWTLTMIPTLAALQATSSSYDGVVLGAGVIMVIVAGFLLHLNMARQLSLRESEERFRVFAQSTSDWFWETDAEGHIVNEHDSDGSMLAGRPFSDVKGMNREEIAGDLMDNTDWQPYRDALANHTDIKDFEYRYRGLDGAICHALINGKAMFDDDGTYRGHRGTASNITRQRLMEEQLRRSQRMEAVGQLTGGVAHDFNNLMAIMIGNAELLQERVAADHEAAHHAAAIIRAVDRGSALTNRLLAFSRQQALSPESTNIEQQIDGLHDMLRRTLGETVDLRVIPAENLWPATIDAHQFENSLINLAINARDAMPAGGRLTIETANVTLDKDYTDQQEEVAPGDYVRIAVSDTGNGMSPEVQAKVFEPFFTTKEVGKGSGLGLSMVYGFAKQSGGHVSLDSEVGVGTTVYLFLPRADAAAADSVEPEDSVGDHRAAGRERVLIVEDDASVREIPASILRAAGYEVFEAEDSDQAFDVLDMDETRVDLLFTDVVLPGGLNGREIAERARRLHPGIKVLYTSGYTENVITHQSHLDSGIELLIKPYRRGELLTKVRAALDGGA
jgi:PAS domain S-box-containing protein